MKGSYIDRMFVDPSQWRKGWGTRLVAFAKSLSPNGLELHTHQENHAVRMLYERHGFQAVKFGTSPHRNRRLMSNTTGGQITPQYTRLEHALLAPAGDRGS